MLRRRQRASFRSFACARSQAGVRRGSEVGQEDRGECEASPPGRAIRQGGAEQFGEPGLDRGEVVGKARAAAVGDDSIGAAVQWMLGHASVAAIA